MEIKKPFYKTGLIGWPIHYSLSSYIHTYWLKKYKIKGSYTLYPVAPEKLSSEIQNFIAQDFLGFNVTMPYKESIIKYLNDLTPEAKYLQTVNVVMKDPQKGLIGDNTDGYGFVKYLEQKIPDWRKKIKSVLIFGAGGAAKAIIGTLIKEDIKSIIIVARNKERTQKYFSERYNILSVFAWEENLSFPSDISLIVNATNLGMNGFQDFNLDYKMFNSDAIFYDLVYNPLQTNFLKKAKNQGYQIIDGLGMLMYQAAPAFEKWYGIYPSIDDKLQKFITQKAIT
ncbi:MAG: shikimate dehydrogenase [Alphaproteobacteria bacterium]|nr:shikimate dehydrogenase [Alphaproteobacteria bacterium]